MKIVKQLTEFVMGLQIVLTVLFIIQNFSNLNSVTINFTITDTVSIGFTLNFYALLAIVAGIMATAALTGVQVLGSGLNEEGSKILSRTIFFIATIIFLEFASIQFFTFLDTVGVIIVIILFPLCYLLYGLTELHTPTMEG